MSERFLDDPPNPTPPRSRGHGWVWGDIGATAQAAKEQPDPGGNWAGNQHWPNAKIVTPVDVPDLQRTLQAARQAGTTVGTAGFTGAWSPLLDGHATLVSLDHEHFHGVCVYGNGVPVPTACQMSEARPPWTVKAGAGQTMGQLDTALKDFDLCMRTSTVIPYPTVGGVLATGGHGTGRGLGMVADYAVEMEVVNEHGTTTYKRGDPVWPALMLNLGACGIVISVTFEVEPMFNVHVQDVPRTWAAKHFMSDPDTLEAVLDGNDYAELFWWPLAEHVWVKTGNRTSDRRMGNVMVGLNDRVRKGGSDTLHEIGTWVAEDPSRTREALTLMSAFIRHDDYIAEAPVAYHYQRHYVRAWDLCYAIPITDYKQITEAWMYVYKKTFEAQKADRFPLNLTLHTRWLRESAAWLSPLHAKPNLQGLKGHLMVEILNLKPTANSTDWIRFYEDVEQKWLDMGGVPHWAKLFAWGSKPDDPAWTKDQLPSIKHAYGQNLHDFAKACDALDPSPRLFRGNFVRSLIGP